MGLADTAWSAAKWVGQRPFRKSTYIAAATAFVTLSGVGVATAAAAATAQGTALAVNGVTTLNGLSSALALTPAAPIGLGEVFQGAAQTGLEALMIGGQQLAELSVEHVPDALSVLLGAGVDIAQFGVETWEGLEATAAATPIGFD